MDQLLSSTWHICHRSLCGLAARKCKIRTWYTSKSVSMVTNILFQNLSRCRDRSKGIARLRIKLTAEGWYYHHLFDYMESFGIFLPSMQRAGRSEQYRWRELASTKAMIALCEQLVESLLEISNNHSLSLHQVCTSLHIIIQNTV